MNHNRKTLFFVAILAAAVAAVLLIVFVSRKRSGETIHLGSILILSGEYSSYGEQFRDGAMIAAAELNRDSNARQVKITFHDSEGSKSKTVELVQVLHDRDRVRYVADIMGTGLALEAASSFNDRKMLVLSGVNTGPELSSIGGRFFFRVIPSDAVAAGQLARWAMELGLKRAVLIHDVDDWGKGLATEIRRAYRDPQVQIVDDVDCQHGLQLVSPLVSRLAVAKPEIVFLLVYPREGGLILREAARQGIASRFMGTENFTGSELVEHAGNAAEGVMFVLPGEERRVATPSGDLLARKYKESHGAAQGVPLFAATGYDVVTILADVARRFGDDTEAAARYLHKATYQGASGKISFGDNGDVNVNEYRRLIFRRRADGNGIQAAAYSGSDRL